MKINLLSIFKKIFREREKTEPDLAYCPKCGNLFNIPPKRKSKCGECGGFVYVRTDYKTKKRLYLSEQGKDSFDKEERDNYFQSEWRNKLLDRGVKEEELLKIESDLKSKWQIQDIAFNDLVWAAFGQRVITLSKESASFDQFSALYFSWALFACEINNSPIGLMRVHHKYELLEMKKLGFVEKVKIVGSKGCEECKNLEGKIFNLSELLPEQEILPHKFCTHWKDLGYKYPWCRCFFSSILLH
jgi:hypothetical protein